MKKKHSWILLPALVVAAASVALHGARADGIPSDENALVYEGTLERDGVPYDGSADVLVSLWSEATTAGAPTYEDVSTGCGTAPLDACECAVAQTVTASAGRFAVPLSADCAAAVRAHPDLWVEVRAVVGGSTESFGRTRLSASPYAIEADRAAQARDSLDGVPVGGIIDWWRPDATFAVPDGFVICDGRSIPSGPMSGHSTPDLTGRFVRGSSIGGIGDTGGAAPSGSTVTTSSSGEHSHRWMTFTDVPGEGNTTTFRYTAPGGSSFMEFAYPMWRTVNRDSSWSVRSYYAPTLYDSGSVDDADFHTWDDGEHTHSVTLPAGSLPPYVGLLKLMRYE